MLIFSKLRFKNLLSFGNMWTNIDLSDKSSVLIQGSNGSGKSAAILDSLTFVLYGKPFRKINKTGLVNNRNKKELIVEVWFKNDSGNEFKITRGTNPSVFEIYKDGNLINQDASVIDYQEQLEKNILKMDFNTFTQIVVLGKATYVAFLRLSQGDRRKFRENLLNLTIFGVMNDITKARFSDVKNKLGVIKNSLSMLKKQVEMMEKHIADFKQESIKRQIEHEKILNDQIIEIQNEIELLREDIVLKRNNIVEIDSDLDGLNKKLNTCHELQSQVRNKLNDIRKKSSFFSENDICPTCENEINDDIRQVKIAEFNKKEEDLTKVQEQLSIKTDTTVECIQNIQSKIEKNRQLNNEISLMEQLIQQKMTSIIQAEKSKSVKITSSDDKIQSYQNELNNLLTLKESQNYERTLCNSQQDCLEFILAMLKDSGIKTTIIRRHIPNIVSTMNHYLREMGLFVRFELNEDFEETFYGRGIDPIPYNAYSEGEKLRIDLAMLLTWREIAKRQNNLSVNFIIFDEILDSSADSSGIENLLDIFKIMKNEGTKIFVISHSDHWTDKFDKIWTIEKSGGFSVIRSQSA